MKYNETQAKELGLKYNLSYFTLNRWKKTKIIPDMYNKNGERLLDGMTLREAKNYTKLSIKQLQALLYLESGDEKIHFHEVSISYWFSGKRKPRKEWLWNILERKIKEHKEIFNLE